MINDIDISLLSSSHAISTDFPDSLSPSIPIIHRSSQLPPSFFLMPFVNIYVLRSYCCIDTHTAYFIFSDRSEFHMIDNQSIAFPFFANRLSTSLSADEMFLSRYVNWSINSRSLPFRMGMAPFV